MTTASDSFRPPVLYLRTFASDIHVSELERHLVSMLQSVGPVVAFAGSNNTSPRLGATRLHASDSEWKQLVTDLMDRARLVVLLAGSGQGLAWEMSECVRRVSPARLIIGVPADADAFAVFAQRFNEAAGVDLSGRFIAPPRKSTKLRAFLATAFGDRNALAIAPSDINGLICFDANWRPIHYPVQAADYELRENFDTLSGKDLSSWESRLGWATRRVTEHLNRMQGPGAEPLSITHPVSGFSEEAPRVAGFVRMLIVMPMAVIWIIATLYGCVR